MDERQKWHVAWARFTAFRNSMPSRWHPQAVEEFHGILSALEAASSDNDDLTDFRIPKEMMKPIPVSIIRATMRTPGQVTYSKEVYCDREYAQRQVEGVAAYFEARNPLKR